ncbi:naphthoate synthase [Actinomadura sp. NBRC 104412]|uniref:enoyl-CoA hydratase-related protein n=1 Tax=Actinomadura sp. NBRC 104412 TaxID=3032203 RepID=UPI0024A01D83|nr:enoyl-CoA hydratase-related protein [Actinomadura sp. NBRC 104412]GLZ07509.1 naphthoate synthase [Actinomadura sp. NBRC 104412]
MTSTSTSSPGYTDIVVEPGVITTITINRPGQGNKFRARTAIELADALRAFRDSASARVAVLTGAGERFFCIGGEHEPPTSTAPAAAMPIVDVYELLDTSPKPVIAAVNGYAVGGGNVLALACDLTIAADHAVFRQVGPMVGSFDAGYGTWLLEETVGRKRAKEIWYLNRKYTAREALRIGLINEIVPIAGLAARARDLATELSRRSPAALAALKAAFSARHSGIAGQARLAHDQLLTFYLHTEEATEMSAAFTERRAPDSGRFYR